MLARPPLWLFLFSAFVQAAASGPVAAAIVTSQWVVVFCAAFFLNVLWWFNSGQRIDRHAEKFTGIWYSLASASGVVLGAWWWL